MNDLRGMMLYYITLSLSLYIYMCVCVCVCVCTISRLGYYIIMIRKDELWFLHVHAFSSVWWIQAAAVMCLNAAI